eukprot:maker-scaffold_2-snap-gene-20.38-mRNA-1 protein AED:0.00 eAED:0.00 QI:88/1/1/1/1/1/2/60/214
MQQNKNEEIVEVVEIQSSIKDGPFSYQLDSLDGPNRFFLKSGEAVEQELTGIKAPSGYSWFSNWKIKETKLSQNLIIKASEGSSVMKYPRRKNRQLKMTTWFRVARKYEVIEENKMEIPVSFLDKELVFEEISQEDLNNNDKTLKERNSVIKSIATEIKEANETMKQLATIVNAQNEPLSEISKQTEKTKEKTQKAVAELQKAEKMQGTDCVIC